MKTRVFKTNMLSWHVQFNTYCPEIYGFKLTLIGGFPSWACAYQYATHSTKADA